MTRPGPRRPPSSLLALAAACCLAAAPSGARAVDCSALRAAIDAAGPVGDPAQADAALRRQRDEILRTRDYANRTGCGDGIFDDPDSIPCRSLARRIGMLQVGLQRLQDQAARGVAPDDADDRRRDLQARFDAQCTAESTFDRQLGSADAGDAPSTTVPIDPDAPSGPATQPRASRVLCVRHCDGAFYPLATDVAADRMADMDRICQAQCPSAESSAYAGGSEDVSAATATDGSTYSSLPSAFGYLKGSVQACSCRAPHQSWAEALAGAESLLQPHKGDVTVTAELAAAMARPTASAQPTAPKAVPAAAGRGAKRKAAPLPGAPAAPDIMRGLRGSDPPL